MTRRARPDPDVGALQSEAAHLPGPERTCVGCRTRAAQATLLRIVAVGDVLVPDPARRRPGRGASLHLDLRCVDLAERRKAFPRALRLAGPLDLSAVREHVAGEQAAREQGAGQDSRRRPSRAVTTAPDESRQSREQHSMSQST